MYTQPDVVANKAGKRTGFRRIVLSLVAVLLRLTMFVGVVLAATDSVAIDGDVTTT